MGENIPTVNILGAKMLLKILRATRFKKPFTVSIPPPWSRLRDYLAGRSAAQIRVNDAFKAAAAATAKLPLSQRMEIIGDAMRGLSFGGVKRARYPAVSPAELARKKEEVKAAVRAAAAIVR